MKILIAGAGIGGLATAAALQRSGHQIVVVERASHFGEAGAPIAMQPHAMRCLDLIGVGDRLRQDKKFMFPEMISFNDMISGKEFGVYKFGQAGEKLYGARLAVVHRRDLIDALSADLTDDCVLLNSEITDAEQDENSVSLRLSDGSVVTGDLLIAADGLNSTVRTAIFGEMPSVFTGFLAWRSVVPASNFKKTFPDIMSIWAGSGRHVISYPFRQGTQVYTACYVPADEILREDWSTSGDVNELASSFADACPEVREIIAGIDESFITGINYRQPLETWHKGRVVLLGDAAHPVIPTSGSGAGMGIEDAIAITACIDQNKNDHEQAFVEFEARRKARTTRVLTTSHSDLQAFHERDPDRVVARGRVNAGISRIDPTGYKRFAWLNTYNEIEQSAKSYKEFSASVDNPLRRPKARQAFDLWQNAMKLDDLLNSWISERDGYERFGAKQCPVPAGAKITTVKCDDVSALHITVPEVESGPIVLHLHGGGHIYGSSQSSAGLAARVARSIKGSALVPDFRLVPEYSAEDQLADVLKAYRWAANQGVPVYISAECGGAGLALLLAMALRDSGESQPLGLYLLSPFVDMTISAPSITANMQCEPWLSQQRLVLFAGAYTQGSDPAQPKFSPLFGDLSNLPPMQIFAAKNEALADDAISLAEKVNTAGGVAALTLVEDSVHDFALFDFLPETDAFYKTIELDASKRTSK